MEHVAHWVRFADTKATILAAGLGVIITMLMTNASTVEAGIREGCVQGATVAVLAVGACGAALWTLYWVVSAIAPRTSTYSYQLNRFAWPALAGASLEQIKSHVDGSNIDDDAWLQTTLLASIAKQKFTACMRAVWGFAALLVTGVACVVAAVGVSG
jgi:hypothetical protein